MVIGKFASLIRVQISTPFENNKLDEYGEDTIHFFFKITGVQQ